MSWREFLHNKNLLIEFILSIIVLIFALSFISHFLDFVEQRQGVVLADPLLKTFQPVNLTWLIFALIYLSLFFTIAFIIKHPQKLLFAIQAYSLMLAFRIIAMYLLPLNPPARMILLNDPFVQFFGTGQALTKDLFFSGHTATLFLFFLLADKKLFKYLLLAFTVTVAVAVILQHVHYSIDVFAAPFFAYAAYRVIRLMHLGQFKIENEITNN
ncbi:MAG: phosphatase PAP2-related protein [Ignavibacteriaceae bacterium]